MYTEQIIITATNAEKISDYKCGECGFYKEEFCTLFHKYKRDYNNVPKRCETLKYNALDGKNYNVGLVLSERTGDCNIKIKQIKK